MLLLGDGQNLVGVQNNPKNLNLSYKMDADFWDCLAKFHRTYLVICIHVINFKEASERFFFHFLEVFEKMYRIYKTFLHSFQGDFKILVKSDIF